MEKASAYQQYNEACPAFVYPLILSMRDPLNSMSSREVADAMHRISLCIPDATRLRHLLDPEGTGRYDNFYPSTEASATISTNDAIETFLSTYGHTTPAEEELINRMIFNPVPADYALTLEKEGDSPAGRTHNDDLIDNFISSHPEEPSSTVSNPAIAAESCDRERSEQLPSEISESAKRVSGDSLLSQSLAKIFIKQRNYRQAYEIIHTLNLKYPEKSIYFADQLRFLQKLIVLQDANNKKQKNKK